MLVVTLKKTRRRCFQIILCRSILCCGLALSYVNTTDSVLAQVSGSDVLPTISAGKLVTGAHLDATGADVSNVRVFGYSLQLDPGDPYYTQDPGFNAPAGALPAGSVFGYRIIGGLKYWNGSNAVNLSAPPSGESMLYNFGTNNRTITGSSGDQAGFNIGTVAANGSIHKHLNAFLQGSNGNSDPTLGGTFSTGVYNTTVRLISTAPGIAESDPVYFLYDNGVGNLALDRAKFQLRNLNAPGSRLGGTVNNLIGLSALPGEENVAGGGQVSVSGSGGQYRSQINTLTGPRGIGSAAINHIGTEGKTLIMLWLNGSNGDIDSLIASLDGRPEYDISGVNVGNSDPLYSTISALQNSYTGFNALVAFDSGVPNGSLTWDFSGAANRDGLGNITSFKVLVEKAAAVPEPSAIAVLVPIALLFARKRRLPTNS